MAELKQKNNIGGDGFSGGADNVFDELDELLRSISVKVDIDEDTDGYDLGGEDEHIGEITGDLGAYDALYDNIESTSAFDKFRGNDFTDKIKKIGSAETADRYSTDAAGDANRQDAVGDLGAARFLPKKETGELKAGGGGDLRGDGGDHNKKKRGKKLAVNKEIAAKIKAKPVRIIAVFVALAVIVGAVWYAAAAVLNLRHIPIFMYHSINDEPIGSEEQLSVRVDDFESQLRYLRERGYESVFVKDMPKYDYEQRLVAVTFDDGYEDVYTNAFPLLKKYEIKATLFMPTSLIGEEGYLDEDQLREMQNSGYVDVESHTVSHEDLSRLSTDEIENEFRESKRTLEDILDKTVNVIAYPGGYVNSDVEEIAGKYFDKAVLAKSQDDFSLFVDEMAMERLGVYRDTTTAQIDIVCRRKMQTYGDYIGNNR